MEDNWLQKLRNVADGNEEERPNLFMSTTARRESGFHVCSFTLLQWNNQQQYEESKVVPMMGAFHIELKLKTLIGVHIKNPELFPF